MSIRLALAAAFVAALAISPAYAQLTVTNKPTRNVVCKSGVCKAKERHANLNAGDLENLLEGSDVAVVSGRRAMDIEFAPAPQFFLNGSHRLLLDSFRAITVDRVIRYEGSGGGLDLKTNDGGTGGALNFGDRGSIIFSNPSSGTLTIDGANYVLVSNVHALAGAVFENPSGNFALSQIYDANVDGPYRSAPVSTVFSGHFEGLGNALQHVTILVPDSGASVGLFSNNSGTISHLRLSVRVKAGQNAEVGALAGSCNGSIDHVEVSGQILAEQGSSVGGVCGVLNGTLSDAHSSANVTGKNSHGISDQSSAGGLVGSEIGGTIANSSASGNVDDNGGTFWNAGGLIGTNQGAVQNSFATGAVVVGDDAYSGGLIGTSNGTMITNCYATGVTQGGVNSNVGGFIAINHGLISQSYSSGAVASGSGNAVGGFIGTENGVDDLNETYFDIDTSGQSHGVGNNTGYEGITGLTTAQFQAGLPEGFDPAVWAESPSINGGLPYLIANPPQ